MGRRLAWAACALGLGGFLGCGSGGGSAFSGSTSDGTGAPDDASSSPDSTVVAPLTDAGPGGFFTSAEATTSRPALSGDGGIVLPANFVHTQFGGYALGPPLVDAGSDGGIVQSSNSAN